MVKIRQNERGIGAIGIILALVIVYLVGIAGWFVHKNHRQNPNFTTSTASQKSYTLKYEKLSFQYPSSWHLEDFSEIEYPNQNVDAIEIRGPNYFTLDISDGSNGIGAQCPNDDINSIMYSQPINFAGNSYYLNYISSHGVNADNKGLIGLIALESQSQTSSTCIQPKGKNTKGNISIFMAYKIPTFGIGDESNSTKNKPESIVSVKNDSNFQVGSKIIESMSY